MPANTLPALFDRAGVGQYLNVSERIVGQWSSSVDGFPKPIALPGRITRWRRADLDQWLETLPAKTEFAAIGKKKD